MSCNDLTRVIEIPAGNSARLALHITEQGAFYGDEERYNARPLALEEVEDLRISLYKEGDVEGCAAVYELSGGGMVWLEIPDTLSEGLWGVRVTYQEAGERRRLERPAFKVVAGGRPVKDPPPISMEVFALAKGKDGHTPKLQTRQAANGMYYLTSDGEAITDEEGRRFYLVREALTAIDEVPEVVHTVGLQYYGAYTFNDLEPYKRGDNQLGPLSTQAGVALDWEGVSGITLPYSWVRWGGHYSAGARLQLRPVPKQWIYEKIRQEGRRYRLGLRVWIRPGVKNAAIQLSGGDKVSSLSGLVGGVVYTLGLDVNETTGLQEVFIAAPYFEELGVAGYSILDLRYYDVTDLEE